VAVSVQASHLTGTGTGRRNTIQRVTSSRFDYRVRGAQHAYPLIGL
jgi:hypothetical protein